MASKNAFDLLNYDDTDDVEQLIAKLPVPTPAAKPVKPSKPLPPAQAVREANGQRGGGRSGGRGTGRDGQGAGGRGTGRDGQGGRAFNRDSYDNQYTNGNNNGGYRQPLENGDYEKPDMRAGGGYRPKRSDHFNGDAAEGERPRRTFERHSVVSRGSEFKRDGAGRGNWGRVDDVVTEAEEVVAADTEKVVDSEKQEETADTNKENTAEVTEQKEPEKEEMTLEEYEKVLEEKRKALVSVKTEERKVALDKDLAKMQLLSSKKSEEEFFVKLGTDKDKKKDASDKEEKAKKSVSIEEFLKPADGERYNSGGRGRGRGRGFRGGYTGGNRMNNVVAAPSIEDVGQFPSLSVK